MDENTGNLAGKRILLVEDEPVLAEIIATFLDMAGVSVETVHQHAEAIQRLDNDALHAWDGLISDVNLSDGSGFDLARLCRQHQPGFPIILISGTTYDNRSFPQQEETGPVVFLKKPFSHTALIKQLQDLYI